MMDKMKKIRVQLYNNHNFRWISLEQSADDIYKDIQNFVNQNPHCEEWFISDSENLPFEVHQDYTSEIEKLLEDIKLVENTHYDTHLVMHIAKNYTENDDISEAIDFLYDNYEGNFTSDVAFAENLLDETGQIDEIPYHLQYYFDYEAYARDIMINDYNEFQGHYYRNC